MSLTKSDLDKINFAMKYYGPAYQQHAAGKKITAKHPDTGEVLQITEMPEIGVMVLSTPKLGVLERTKYKPQKVV